MATLRSREIAPTDVEGVVLRPADEAECRAAGLEPKEAIILSSSNSFVAQAIEVDGELAAFWGYGATSFLSNICVAWLLTTPVCNKHKMKFCRVTQRMIRELLETWPTIEVLVDSRHMDSIRWLSWLGFKQVAEDHSYSVPFNVMRRVR